MAVEKVALITAGGTGIAAAAARRLAEDGFHIGILSSSGVGEALAQELGGVGVTGSSECLADLGRLVDLAQARWGRVDVLINSTGHEPRCVCINGATSRVGRTTLCK
jgi:NAD(P)-dependent dehydrogenase (short-subunit alcohol dehydrogenase family)